MLRIETIRLLCMFNLIRSILVFTHTRTWLTPQTFQTFFQQFESIANTPDISMLCYLLDHFLYIVVTCHLPNAFGACADGEHLLLQLYSILNTY